MRERGVTQESRHHTHSAEIRQVYERVLAGSTVHCRHVEVGPGNSVHLLERGAGQPVVLLHGTGTLAGFFCPC